MSGHTLLVNLNFWRRDQACTRCFWKNIGSYPKISKPKLSSTIFNGSLADTKNRFCLLTLGVSISKALILVYLLKVGSFLLEKNKKS